MQKEYLKLKINEIKPYEKNPRKNEAAVPDVAESIKEVGYITPIVVDENNVILCGHTRLKALKKNGEKEVDGVLRVSGLTDEQKRKYRLLDNKTNEKAEWDFDLLAEEVADLDFSGFDLDWGIEEVETEKEIEEDNFDIDSAIPEEPKANYGDVYQLGEHRLMCGDSTKEEDVAKLMNGELADLVVTDPPYNVDISNSKGMKIENDNLAKTQFKEFLQEAFFNINTTLKEGGAFYIWHASRTQREFEDALNDNGLFVKEQIIWNKSSFTFGRSDYHWKHEPCFYGWKDGASHYFTDDRTQSTVIEDKGIDLKKLKKEEMLKLLQDIYSEKVSTTIINEEKPSNCDLHPTMKPIKLLARLIKNSSRLHEIVIDLFGGSGSTLIACEQLNRKCYIVEYDPKYVDVIIKRWEDFTGKKAVKINV